MKKLLRNLLLVVVGLVVVGYFLRNFIARKAVEIGAKQVTGFPLEIGSVEVGVFGGTLEVMNLKMMNPPEFSERSFVTMPLFKVDYHSLSMLSGAPHIKEVIVNVEELVVTKNEKGETNAQVLQARVLSPATDAGQAPSEPGALQRYRVDLVKVHIGTVRILDYSRGGKPSEKRLTLNKDVVFRDVTESVSITALVMKTVLGPVGEVAGDLVKGVGGVTKAAGDTLQKGGKGLFDSIKKVVPQQ